MNLVINIIYIKKQTQASTNSVKKSQKRSIKQIDKKFKQIFFSKHYNISIAIYKIILVIMIIFIVFD